MNPATIERAFVALFLQMYRVHISKLKTLHGLTYNLLTFLKGMVRYNYIPKEGFEKFY
jgi:hypothetical protein